MAAMFQNAPEPKTELGRYRILSSHAGVRVSPIVLGGMSLGTAWTGIMNSADKEQSFKMLDTYYEAGGNWVDTSNNYQDQESEQIIGEWMKERNNRDHMFIATKFSSQYRYDLDRSKTVNFSGNSKKSLHMSIRDSLKKLQTDYIDLLYIHFWDWTASIEEVMDSLHTLVESGKVLYLGVSDTPAWIVSAANTYARAHGKTPFCVYQGRWSLLHRDFERDIIPMCRQFGLSLAPFDVVGGGKFQTKKQLEERKKAGENLRSFFGPEQTPDQEAISAALEKVAAEHGTESITQIALAYVMQKAHGINVFPIVGGRKVEHLQENIKALSIHLTDEQIEYLESVKPFDIGFPMIFTGDDPRATGQTSIMIRSSGHIAWQRYPKPIGQV